MSHFLLKKDDWRERYLSQSWYAVAVELIDQTTLRMVKDDTPGIAKVGTYWALLPTRIKLLGPDGKPVTASKERPLWVSTETFNPFHLITEAPDEIFDATFSRRQF